MTDSISVPAAELRRALTAVLPHAGDDDTLPSLTCVRFEAQDGCLYLVTTDRYSMAVAKIGVPGGCQAQDTLLPGRAARALRRMLKGAGGVAALRIEDGKLTVAVGKRESATWATAPGEFVKWRPMLGKLLAAEPAHLDDDGLSPAKLARFTVPGDQWRSEPMGMRVTASRDGDGKSSPAVLFMRGDWFLGALMPVRCGDPAAKRESAWADLSGCAAESAPAAEAVTSG